MACYKVNFEQKTSNGSYNFMSPGFQPSFYMDMWLSFRCMVLCIELCSLKLKSINYNNKALCITITGLGFKFFPVHTLYLRFMILDYLVLYMHYNAKAYNGITACDSPALYPMMLDYIALWTHCSPMMLVALTHLLHKAGYNNWQPMRLMCIAGLSWLHIKFCT